MYTYISLLIISVLSVEDLVWDLSDIEISIALEYNPKLLINFYSSTCDKCSETSAEFIQAAHKLNENSIRLGKVDCSLKKDFCESLGIEILPYFLYFVQGKPYPYTGSFTKEGIVSWVQPRHLSSYMKISESQNLENIVSKNRQSLVFFGNITEEYNDLMQTLSLEYNKIHFITTNKIEDSEKYFLKPPAVVLFKGDDQIECDLENENLKDFVEKNKPAEVFGFNEQSIKMIFDDKTNTFFYLRPEVDRVKYQLTIERLADMYNKHFLFVETDLSMKGSPQKLAQAFGLKSSHQPLAFILNFTESGILKYRTQATSLSVLCNFIEDYLSDFLVPFYKSQPLPDESVENNVRILVGLNHDEVASDKKKNVLVLYYTEGHKNSTAFIRIYEELASYYTKVNDIVIAKIDIVHNEVRSLIIPDIPFLVYFPKNYKQGYIFDREPTISNLKMFIAKPNKKILYDL